MLPLTCGLASGGGADVEPPLVRLSLNEARNLSFERNWDLLAAQAGVDQAAALKLVAQEFPNPTLSLNSSKINTPLRKGNGTEMGNRIWDRSYDTVVSISQLFEIGGKRTARKESARAGAEAAAASFSDARRTLDLAVTKAYIAVLLAEENCQIYRETAVSLEHEANIAETRFKAGDVSTSDKAQIEIAAARARLDAEAAQSAVMVARISVEVLLGEKQPTGKWTPTDTLEMLTALPESVEAGKVRPDLLAATANLRKAEAELRLQKAMRISDPTLQLQYERQPPDQSNTLGFGISFPLPIELNTGNIRAAIAAREQARAAVGKVEAQAAAEVASAEFALAEAKKRWKRYAKEIQPKSSEVLKTVEYSYQKGKAALLELLSAERTNNEARLATALSKADTATAAVTLAIAKNLTRQPLSESKGVVPEKIHVKP